MFGLLQTVFCFILPITCSPQSLKEDIKFKNCGPEGSITNVNLSPCDSEPCSFHHGANITVTINFMAAMDASALQAKVYGEVGPEIPFPLPNPDACKGCNLNCPISKGGNYTYKNIFPVKSSYPDIKLVVKWEIVNENKQPLVCFEFPMQIQG